MANKKVIAGIIISVIAVVAIVALIPVSMYGTEVKVNKMKINTSMGVMGSPSTSVQSSSSQEGFGCMDYGSGSSFECTAEVTTEIMNPYTYLFDQMGSTPNEPDFVTSEEFEEFTMGGLNDTSISINFTISIYFNITSPNSEFYEYTYTLEDLMNLFSQDTELILGPEDIEIVNGTYIVGYKFTISLSVSIAGWVDYNYSEDFSWEDTFEVEAVIVE